MHLYELKYRKLNGAILVLGTPTNQVYIIPRGGVFVLGGTYYEGKTEDNLTDDERKRLVLRIKAAEGTANKAVNEASKEKT